MLALIAMWRVRNPADLVWSSEYRDAAFGIWGQVLVDPPAGFDVLRRIQLSEERIYDLDMSTMGQLARLSRSCGIHSECSLCRHACRSSFSTVPSPHYITPGPSLQGISPLRDQRAVAQRVDASRPVRFDDLQRTQGKAVLPHTGV
jgi:bacterioferritin-associated ferredoxin